MSTVEESIEETGKRPLSTKWVMREPTPKKPKWKARLVVRGFEEPKRGGEMNFAGTTESGVVRTMLAVCARRRSRGWEALTADVSQAFLNAELVGGSDHPVFVKSPTREVWRLKRRCMAFGQLPRPGSVRHARSCWRARGGSPCQSMEAPSWIPEDPAWSPCMLMIS